MIAALLVAICLFSDRPAIIIDRTPATAQRVMFDPQDPPANIPKANEGERAIIESRFDVRCTFSHEVISNAVDEVTVRLRDPRITLSMHNTIYLPNDVRLALRTHEEGHRVISERIYNNEAEAIARDVAASVLQKSWTAPTIELALVRAEGDFRYEYRSRIARRLAEVNARYDQLTQHGKDNNIRAVDAIDQAFEPPPTTGPTK
jgi:hypothetical protein